MQEVQFVNDDGVNLLWSVNEEISLITCYASWHESFCLDGESYSFYRYPLEDITIR